MAKRRSIDNSTEFKELLNLVSPLIANHVQPGFDELISSWLDPDEEIHLHRKYKVMKYVIKL